MSMRTMLVFLAIAVGAATEQTRVPAEVNPAEVLSHDSDEIVIKRGERIWRVDLSRLIRNNDCAWHHPETERVCTGRASAPCPECPRRSSIIGWDVRHNRLYFGVSTGSSHNNSWTVFSYSLGTRRVARFTNTWAARLGSGTVSRSGRYLAYVNSYHGGMCSNSSSIEIVDLWEHRVARPKLASTSDKDITQIDALRWTSASSLGYEVRVQVECGPDKFTERQVRGAVEVATLAFQ